MKVQADCVHCYLKQVVSTMKQLNIDEKRQYEILYEIMEDIKSLDLEKTPAYNSSVVLRKAYELIGSPDPYKAAKKESNDLALSHYDELEEKLESSKDRLHDALKISAAGNVIDLGIYRNFDLSLALEDIMKKGFSIDCYEEFKRALEGTEEVLIIGDNSGEIVFDKLLVKELKRLGKKVVYTVKSEPILNDSTMEDAEYVGMTDVAEVVETGSGHLGVSFEDASEEFSSRLKDARLIISKGQANFESLEDIDWIAEKTFFLLKIKCEEVASESELDFNSMVFLRKS